MAFSNVSQNLKLPSIAELTFQHAENDRLADLLPSQRHPLAQPRLALEVHTRAEVRDAPPADARRLRHPLALLRRSPCAMGSTAGEPSRAPAPAPDPLVLHALAVAAPEQDEGAPAHPNGPTLSAKASGEASTPSAEPQPEVAKVAAQVAAAAGVPEAAV